MQEQDTTQKLKLMSLNPTILFTHIDDNISFQRETQTFLHQCKLKHEHICVLWH
jgi:hypothetical protein